MRWITTKHKIGYTALTVSEDKRCLFQNMKFIENIKHNIQFIINFEFKTVKTYTHILFHGNDSQPVFTFQQRAMCFVLPEQCATAEHVFLCTSSSA
jgi:hypothetical protein